MTMICKSCLSEFPDSPIFMLSGLYVVLCFSCWIVAVDVRRAGKPR